ncbi:MAG: AI-2E family transporter [Candidatus Korobacteraceae bacterium]
MSIFDSRTARALTTVLVFVVAAWFVYEVRSTLILVLFSVFFAYLLEPIVLRIERSPIGRNSRGLAILETYVICGGVLTLLLFIFGPRIADDMRQLIESIPSLLDRVASGKIVWQLGSRHGWSYDTQLHIEQFIASHRDTIESFTSRIGASIAGSLQHAIWVLLVPILAIFFLKDGRNLAEGAIHILNRRKQRRFLRDVARDLDEMLASFIGAQLILAGAATLVLSSFFWLMHLPYGLALGVTAGFLEFIPVVGPLVAAALVLGVGFLDAFPHLVWIAVFLGLWRLVQDYLISPRVMGHKVELHPMAAIIAVLMGNEIGGVIGVYLSIPVAATLRILWIRWQHTRALEGSAKEPVGEPPDQRIAA